MNFENGFIAIVKKTFRLREVFLLQPLMPPSFYSEYIYDKRYNPGKFGPAGIHRG
jgi:hypothetical protein